MTNDEYNRAVELATAFIKPFEGLSLTAYKCPAGVWTIGYGETQGVKQGDVWSQAKAESTLKKRVGQFMQGVLKACPQLHDEPPQRLAACTSLAYNIGLDAFARSSVCRLTGREAYTAAADAFLLWNKAGGKVLNGLVRRRHAEKKLYLEG